MFKVTLTINLTLTGPIVTQSSAPGSWGLDLVAARNAEEKLYLPGTLLVGNLRQAWQELKDAVSGEHWFKPEIDKWLGLRNENDVPKAKQLYFSDLIYQDELVKKGSDALNRIKIDVERGAVDKHQLVLIESPFLTGKEYGFTGTLHFFATNETEIDIIIRHVKAGLNWTAQLGAMRSTGYGRIKRIDYSIIKAVLQKPDPQIKTFNDKRGIVIRPLYPFCITGRPVADNLFESQAIIPGGAILGAIATTWNQLLGNCDGKINSDIGDAQWPMLKKYFSHVRISHALPSTEIGVRPITLPLSLVKLSGDDTLYDVIQLDGPSLINNEAPAFAVDWKDDANTLYDYGWPCLRRKDYGWPQVTKELRTRTRIDPETLRSAENDLFSYEQVVPGILNWNAELDLSLIKDETDRNTVFNELQSLLSQGIAALSKTKTPASIEFLLSPMGATRTSNTSAINGKQWIVTLQTDTLLGAPRDLDESSGQTELTTMYENAWDDLSDKKLKLVRYFARQRLSGGNYRRSVFQAAKNDYRPWLLTEAGSVFLLETAEGASEMDGEDLIKKWLSQGLPLKGLVLEYYGIDPEINKQWQDCPFIAQNGYGEIAVNLQLHTQLKPEHVTCIPVL